MVLPSEFLLPHAMESEHFIIHYGLRNPLEGRGLGCKGVRDRVLVLTYLDALERLYEVMTSGPWSREKPIVDSGGKTHVYICDCEYPYTVYNFEDSFAFAPGSNPIPYIVLSCRNGEVTTQAELQRAAAEAVHEGTHLFNFTKRPLNEPSAKLWEWFDEGLAVYMETFVAAGNSDYFRHLVNWIDSPEIPLDDPSAMYQAGMFIRYLVKRMGPEFVNKVWTLSYDSEQPLETIARLLGGEHNFASHDPGHHDIFSSGYCIDPYFLWDHASNSHAPDIFARYGERAISHSFALAPDMSAEAEDTLDHLACRYYRFNLRGGVKMLSIELESSDPQGIAPLKAIAASVTMEMRRDIVTCLQPSLNNPGRISTEITIEDADRLHHIMLVVSNCGLRAAQEDERIPHDDDKRYIIRMSAY